MRARPSSGHSSARRGRAALRGGGALVTALADHPTREETVAGTPSPDNYANQHEDHEFTIRPDDPGAVKIDVSWITGEDYDVEVYRKQADGSLTQVGSSGNAPGKPEQVILSGATATPGTYVLRIVYFAAVSDQWTAKIGYYPVTETTTTGHPETYTLTCEVGGQVAATQQVQVARGQQLAVTPCTA